MASKTVNPLVLGYLEKISSRVFEQYPQEIAELVGSKQGVYALYKQNRLYYVGLATDLKRRIKQHLKDKHSGKWDTFSLYLVRKSSHIKELESLILRIADPKGNSVRGRLTGADNLQPPLKRRLQKANDKIVGDLLDEVRKKTKRKKKGAATPKTQTRSNKRTPALAPYTKGTTLRLRRVYKKDVYLATVRKDGTISMGGAIYNSPSLAARAVIKRNANGWTFWRFKDASGTWVPLDTLRKQ